MKKILFPLTMVLLICITTFSCKKKDNEPSKAVTDYLTNGSWKQLNGEVGVGGTFTTDPNWTSSDACEKDDVYTFLANHTYTITEGTSKCDPSDDNLIWEGDWSVSSDQKQLILDGETTTINKIDDTTLIISFEDSGITYRGTFGH